MDPKFGPRGLNPPKTDNWGPGESIDTHIVGLVQILEFGSKSPMDPKFGPRVLNPLKTDCWGPGESIDTNIVGVL